MRALDTGLAWQIVSYTGKTAFKRVRVRDDARIRDVVRHLQAHECVALIGPAFSEKSRLLSDVAAILAATQRYRPLHLDLWQASSSDEATFFSSLSALIDAELRSPYGGAEEQRRGGAEEQRRGGNWSAASHGPDGVPSAPPPLRPSASDARSFQNYLAACTDAGPGHLVLLIDHLQALPPDLVHSLLLALRAAYMERPVDDPRQLVAVVSGGMNLVGLSAGPTSPFNIAKPILVGPLDREQSLALAEATLSAYSAVASDGALEQLVAWAGGDRYSLPLLSARSAELVQGYRANRVDRRVVERAARDLFLDAHNPPPAPIRDAIRTIEEDPDTILDVLHLLHDGRLLRSRARQMPTRTGADRLQLSGAVLLADGVYTLKNLAYTQGLARHFTTERVGHMLRIAGRWQDAIAYLAPQLAGQEGASARSQLLEATVQSIYAADSLAKSWELLARGLEQAFGLADLAIYRAVPARGQLELVYCQGAGERMPGLISISNPDSVEARTFIYGGYALRGTASEARLVVALREATRGRRLGAVTVERYLQERNPHELPTQLPELLHFLEHAGSAIENVMLRSAYREIGQAVLDASAFQPTLQRVLDVAAEALGCDATHLYLLEPGQPGQDVGTLRMVTGVGPLWNAEWQSLAVLPQDSEHPAAACLRDGRMKVVSSSDERLDRGLIARFALHPYTFTYLPLQAAGRPLGTLELAYSDTFRVAPSAEGRATMNALGNQVAIAVHNMQLLRRTDEALARRVTELERLRSSSLAISAVLDLPTVLARIIRDLETLFPGSETTIWGFHAGEWLLSVLQSSLDDPAYLDVPLGMLSATGQAVATGQVQTVADLAALPSVAGHEPAVHLGLRSLIAVPLITQGRVLGAINLYAYTPGSGTLEAGSAELLKAFAAHAAIAIDNARLHEEEIKQQRLEQELAVAHNIQRSLLPVSCPVLPGWDFAATYHAARVVGGDFYDFCDLPGRPPRLGIVIADVTDKGIPAAIFMALSRTVIRTMALSGRGPAAALAQANTLILADNPSDLYLTAVYAVLDPTSGRLIYANAGHNRPLWYHAGTSAVDTLAARGVLLGAFDDIPLQEERVDLAPGDVLLFYTDGITEGLNADGEMFGEERLVELLRLAASGTANQVVEALMSAVSTFTATTEQADDITCVVMKRDA